MHESSEEEHHLSDVLECGKFWKTRLSALKEEHEMIVALIGGVIAISGVILWSWLPGLLPSILESKWTLWAEVIAVIWAISYVFLWRTFLAVRAANRETGRLSEELDSIRNPKLQFWCGQDGDGSVSRDWIVQYLRHGTGVEPVSMKTDFFGVRLTNLGIKPLRNFHGVITQIDRVDVGKVWDKQISVCFEPRSATQREPVESVTLEHGISTAFPICSVREDNLVMASSINMTSRYTGMFEAVFNKPGKFIFHVSLAADDFQTQTKKYLFVWTGNRTDSRISSEGAV